MSFTDWYKKNAGPFSVTTSELQFFTSWPEYWDSKKQIRPKGILSSIKTYLYWPVYFILYCLRVSVKDYIFGSSGEHFKKEVRKHEARELLRRYNIYEWITSMSPEDQQELLDLAIEQRDTTPKIVSDYRLDLQSKGVSNVGQLFYGEAEEMHKHQYGKIIH